MTTSDQTGAAKSALLRHEFSLGLLGLLLACSGGNDNPVAPASTVTTGTRQLLSLDISGATTFQALVAQAKLEATARYSDGSSADISDQSIWETSDAAIVTVSDAGLLTSVSYGNAEVTARFQALTASTPVSVTNACSVALSEVPTFNRHGGPGTMQVQIAEGCEWVARASVDWITITGSYSGSGPSAVAFVVSPLNGVTVREGRVTVVGQSALIQQENSDGSEPVFSYFVTPESRNVPYTGSAFRSYTVTVNTSRPDTQWTATSNQPWLVITAGASGLGEGVVTYRVPDQNPSSVDRTATITVAGLSGLNPPAVHTVRQDPVPQACSYQLSPANGWSVVANGGTRSVAIFATGAQGQTCTWSFSSSASWLSVELVQPWEIVSSGNKEVVLTAAANPGPAVRSASLVAPDDTEFEVRQDGASEASCSYAVFPTTASFGPAGGPGQLTVTTNPQDCSWYFEPSSAEDWVTPYSYDGVGTTTFTYTVKPHNVPAAAPAPRQGTMYVKGHSLSSSIHVTITQDGLASSTTSR